MICQWLNEVIWRPCSALVFTLEITTQNISNLLRMNAGVSRAVHYLTRPVPDSADSIRRAGGSRLFSLPDDMDQNRYQEHSKPQSARRY
jgi:hypothetical protein